MKRNTGHPSIGIRCPYCYQPAGNPCMQKFKKAKDRYYVRTHMARIKEYENLKIINNTPRN